jgi:glucoamylase
MTQPHLNRRTLVVGAAMSSSLGACASIGSIPEEGDLAVWIAAQRARSITLLLPNISPAEDMERNVETRWIAEERWPLVRAEAARLGGRIRLEGDRFVQTITPRPGSVTAAPRGGPDEPDYFFHWIRDSALVMRAVANLAATADAPLAQTCHQRLADFIRFSRSLQLSGAPAGLGETRFNLDGSQDVLQWNRPQFDGPALRALTLMHYESLARDALDGELHAVLNDAINADLDYIAANWMHESYDLWEENKDHDIHARVVQLGAAYHGARRATDAHDAARASAYADATARMSASLDGYWLDGAQRYAHFEPRSSTLADKLDTAAVMAAVHAGLPDGRGSLLDERILSHAVHTEDLFVRLFPINAVRAADEGVLYGRYEGDQYVGGGAWVFTTLEFAEAHYRLATALSSRPSLLVTALNQAFLSRAALRAGAAPLVVGADTLSSAAARRAVLLGLIVRGDDILRSIRRFTPSSGDLPEQFDKQTGAPASSRNLSWSHSSFLSATDARSAAITQLA